MTISPATKKTKVSQRLDLERFSAWTKKECSSRGLFYFRTIFAGIWLIYDLIDISFGQTAKILWFYHAPYQGQPFLLFQVLVVVCEVALLFGWRPRYFAFCAFLARGAIAYMAPLNDFFYFSITVLILSQTDGGGSWRDHREKTLAWPRDLLILQTAWIYFASAFLKLSPPFLSGGDLYARANYEATVLPIPYPHFYRHLISQIKFDSLLARSAVIIELTLSLLLLSWFLFPRHRPRLRIAAIVLAVAVHGFAACFFNVFFFGFSMIAQVAFMTFGPDI